MLFALICTDKPGHLEVRQKNRPAHLAFLETITVKAAGPFTDEAGSPTGSLVIIEAKDMADAKAIAGHDPYARAGLFQSVEIRPWKWLVKNPETV
jgi:uncharacterized protein YciI